MPHNCSGIGLNSDESQTASWSYSTAFSRHEGLFTAQEQERLRRSRVAIAGLGGCGGLYAAVLARMGVGEFHLADHDVFEVANFNRQYGATQSTIGQPKVGVMADQVHQINPLARLELFPDGISEDKLGSFLDGVDLVVDAIDLFQLDMRRSLYREARRRGLWVLFAAPLGCSAAWIAFSPQGMSFDCYFALDRCATNVDRLIAFALGLTPRPTYLDYLDLSRIDLEARRGPSVGFACNLCSGVIGCEAAKILLGWQPVYSAPWSFQFDARRQIFRRGFLRWGNRGWLQRCKAWWFRQRFYRQRMAVATATRSSASNACGSGGVCETSA